MNEQKELQRWLGYRLKALDVKIHLLFIIRFIKTTGWAGKRQKPVFTSGLIVAKRLATYHMKEKQNYELGCKYSVELDPAQIGWLVELQNQFFQKTGWFRFLRILAKVGLQRKNLLDKKVWVCSNAFFLFYKNGQNLSTLVTIEPNVKSGFSHFEAKWGFKWTTW